MAIDSSRLPPSPTSDFPAKKKETNQKKAPKNLSYKTKKIMFRNQYKRIILQNNNGPCPLIAICNVLILRNDMNVDSFQVSQDDLLTLLASKLLNVPRDDTENQRQKISAAMEHLQDLTTGINVNIEFRRIGDFERTRELAVFELLNIPLCHGWIVDPQDSETADAIGCKSYNDLTTGLVNLKTQTTVKAQSGESSADFTATVTPSQPCSKKSEQKKLGKGDLEEEMALLRALLESETEAQTVKARSGRSSVDFTAAITPSQPCSKKTRSFAETTPKSAEHSRLGKGDLEEEMALLQVSEMEMSNICQKTKCDDQVSSEESGDETVCVVGNNIDVGEEVCSTTSSTNVNGALDHDHLSSTEMGDEMVCDVDTENSSKTTALHVTSSDIISAEKTNLESTKNDNTSENSLTSEAVTFDNPDLAGRSQDDDQFYSKESKDATDCDVGNTINVAEESRSTTSVTKSGALESDQLSSTKLGDETICDVETENSNKVTDVHVPLEKPNLESTKNDSGSEIQFKSEPVTFVNPDLTDRSQDEDVALYEAEKCVSLGSPVYKGESLLGKSSSEGKDTNGLTPREGEVIENFLNNNATQLTLAGLFSLQLGVNEGELCVFFRNNHFYTMLKYDGALYTLVTDQGYLNERDLVWEELYEVKGDSVFVTGDFEVFMRDSSNWDQQSAFSNTADYIYKINSSSKEEGMEIDPDLKMAMELQEQELSKDDSDFEVSVKKQSHVFINTRSERSPTMANVQSSSSCLLLYV